VMEGPCAASGFPLRYLQGQCSASVAQPPMKSLSKPFGLGVFEYWETAEEAVAHSRRAYCPHCRGAGWIIRQLRRVHGRDAQPLLARLFGPAPVLPQPPPSSQTPVDITQGAEARRASIFSGEPDTAAQIKYAVTARGYDRTTTGYDRALDGGRAASSNALGTGSVSSSMPKPLPLRARRLFELFNTVGTKFNTW